MAGENLMVGTHAFAHKVSRDNFDETFKKDTDYICYKCFHKWNWPEIDLIDCACPECGAMAKRRKG